MAMIKDLKIETGRRGRGRVGGRKREGKKEGGETYIRRKDE